MAVTSLLSASALAGPSPSPSPSSSPSPDTLMVQPQFAQAGLYSPIPLQVFGSNLNSSCILWVNGSPCSGLSVQPGELDCSFDASKVQGPSSLDLMVSCLDGPTETLKSAVQLYPGLAASTYAATLLPGESITVGAVGGLPPYRFHLDAVNPCLSIDEQTGVLTTSQNCDVKLRFSVQIQDSVGENARTNFTFDQVFHATLPADWNATPELYLNRPFQVEVQGGLAPFSFKVLSGSATIDASTGKGIGGSQPGSVIIQVTDAKGLQSNVQAQNYLTGYETKHFNFHLKAADEVLKGHGFIVQDPKGNFYVLRTLSHTQTTSNHDGSITIADVAAHPAFIPFQLEGDDYQNAGQPIEITQAGDKLEALYSYMKQTDGKILLGAASYEFGFLGKGQHPVLYRLNPDFTAANPLDTSFGSNGILQFEIDHKATESIVSMVETPDGTIYATVRSGAVSKNMFSLVTISSAGKVLSKTMLSTIKMTVDNDEWGQIQLALHGKDVIVAFDSDQGVQIRYVTGNQSVFALPSTSTSNCMLVQMGGNSTEVIVGENCQAQGNPNYISYYGQLLAFHWDGTVDTSVGNAGTILFGDPKSKEGYAPHFQVQTDGKFFFNWSTRLNADGQPDPSFYQMNSSQADSFFETDREMLLYHDTNGYVTIDGVAK